ncbi:MAG: type IV pilus inner membrane component PilO [Planctomycetota bacterium]|jgi:Tfp pilus assembly protein PilO
MLFRERRQILIAVVAAAMIGGFVLFCYLPLRSKMKRLEQARAANTVVVTMALAESERLPGLEEQLEQLKESVGDYEAKIPGHRDLGVFLQEIANLMNKHQLKEQLVEPGKEAAAEALICIPVSMQCKGKLEQIFKFFDSLQELDRLLRVERIKLVNDKDLSGQVSMRTEAVIYYRAQAGQG